VSAPNREQDVISILQRIEKHRLTTIDQIQTLTESLLHAAPHELPALVRALLAVGRKKSPDRMDLAEKINAWVVARFKKVHVPTNDRVIRLALISAWSRVAGIADTKGFFDLASPTRLEVLEAIARGHAVCVQSAASLMTAFGDSAWADVALKVLLSGEHADRILAERSLVDWSLEASAQELDAPIRAGMGFDDLEIGDGATIAARDHLCGQVARAAATVGKHGRSGVVLAASLLLSPSRQWAATRGLSGPGENALAEWFMSDAGPAHAALRGAIRTSPHPVMRQRAWEWVVRKDLRFASLDRISRSAGLYEHEVLWTRTHLLSHPSRVSAIRSLPPSAFAAAAVKPARTTTPTTRAGVATPSRQAGLLPTRSELARLSLNAQRGVPRAIALVLETQARSQPVMLSASPAQELLAGLLGNGDDVARHAAMRASPAEWLNDWCLDASDTVARGAALRRSLTMRRRAEASDSSLWSTLERSPHESVRATARAQMSELQGVSVRARQTLRRKGQDECDADLRVGLLSKDPSQQLAALSLARAMRAVPRLGDEIESLATAGVRLAKSTNDRWTLRVAATAIAALGDAKIERPVLRDAIDAGDARVRANAVETMARIHRGRIDASDGLASCRAILIELKDDAQHRVRANALRGLWTLSPTRSAEDLCRMLRDDRPAHRLAGAWAAGRAAQTFASRMSDRMVGVDFQGSWSVLWATLASIAEDDGDAAVRVRAARALELAPAGAIPFASRKVAA
jgi:hypothetical protein